MTKIAKISAGILALGSFVLVLVFAQKNHGAPGAKLLGESSLSPALENAMAERITEEKWKEAFVFVRDQTRFEPTTLILKSSQDVLWSRSGNAREQALLLADLLREDGEEVRYASGVLEDDKARVLIRSMFPLAREFSYGEDVPLSFPSQNKNLITAVQKHTWVQIFKNDRWVDLDPCFPDAEAGQTFASADKTYDDMDEDFFPRISLSLEVEKGRWEDKRVLDAEKDSVFQWEGTLRDIANQPLSLTILADIQAKEEGGGQPSPMGGILGGLGGRKSKDKGKQPEAKMVEYEAILHLAGDELDRGQFSHTVSAEEKEEEEITRVSLQFQMESPDGKLLEVERLLFEKNEEDQLPHYFQRHSILISGGEIPDEAWTGDLSDFLDNQDRDELKKNLESIRDELKDKKDLKKLLEKSYSLEHEVGPEAGHMINMIFASTSDNISQDLADALAVCSYYSLPRIIINSFEGTGEVQRVSMDLRLDKMEAIPFPGQAEQMRGTFLYGRGVLESILEGKVMELLTGTLPLTTAHLMQIAADRKIPIHMISHLERESLEGLRMSFSTAQKAKNVIDSGHILIIPRQSVPFGGKQRWGWWDLDPRNGEVVGVLDSGLHQAVLERTILDTEGMLHDDMGLVVGALVGCVDTYWVLFALILEYGELDKAALQEAKDYMKNIGNYLCPGIDETIEVGVGVSASIEMEDCWKKEIGIGIGADAGVKIDQGWCANFAKGFKCASTTILNFYLLHAE